MTTETIVCYVIENRLGDIVAFCDTLEFAKTEVRRLSQVVGGTFTIVEHRDTNGQTTHTRVA